MIVVYLFVLVQVVCLIQREW